MPKRECANGWRENCSKDYVTAYVGASVPFTNCGYHNQMCEIGIFRYDGQEVN